MSMHRFHRRLTQNPESTALFTALRHLRDLEESLGDLGRERLESFLRCCPPWHPDRA